MGRRWSFGLRPRLVAAFAVVALGAVIATTGASYLSARTTILQGVQDRAMDTLRTQVSTFAATVPLPPTQRDLDAFQRRLTGYVAVFYRDLRSTSGPPTEELPEEFRTAVHNSDRVLFQRGMWFESAPFLMVGMTVRTQNSVGAVEPTGLEVYAQFDLARSQADISELAHWAWTTGGVALLVAVVIALLAARSVLRPVRELNVAARQLADGQLTTRLRVRGGDELANLASTFNSSAARLQHNVGELRRMEADARRFVADVSHELRTPLTAMTAVIEILEQETDRMPPDSAVAARLVAGETRKLSRLVQDLMEISRFDAGRADLELDEWDVATAVRDTLAARGWQEEVAAELPEGLVARLDRRRLDIVLANLVGNALRHGAPPVTMRLWQEDAGVVIEVTDGGDGLPESVLPHVFDRFYKADSSRARSEGSGLGLAIATENARLHGGTLEAGNQPGGGARFLLRLPGVLA
ncbi:ATP-binding protein [Allokutzneria oryzae]|uniref:histidine kinase n=1 Tax=Allokutzneria oryzae TaxID=1378989 RepID=A0ABV5ZQ20_9PSEU